MKEHLPLIERIGGWISTLLLGNTKEMIIRIDERVQHLSRTVDETRRDVHDLQKAVAANTADIRELQTNMRSVLSILKMRTAE